MSSYEDATIDPKKQFLTFIITRMSYIEDLIYNKHAYIPSVDAMIGLIDSLDDRSKESLKTVREELLNPQHDRLKCFDLYRRTTSYLHKVYLQEVMNLIISTSTLAQKEHIRTPDAKPVPATLSAKLS